MSPRNVASTWTARFIPAFLFCLVAYASYVVLAELCIKYLINPPRKDIPRRITIGISLPIGYFVLLIPVAVCWLRLLLVVVRDPGYIPQGSGEPTNEHEPRPGMEDFWMRDVFVCDANGIPIWCFHCNAWKPDRAHHSQDVGRCTRKMDHFCPWVGGVVGERALKFFIQFLFYSVLLACYATLVLAYYVTQYKDNVQWFVALGIAGFFLLFTFGMTMNSLHFVFRNVTTIENVTRRMYLAVLLPPELQRDLLAPPAPAKLSPASEVDSERPVTSDIDDPSHLNYFSRQGRMLKGTTSSSAMSPQRSKIWKMTITYPLHLPVDRPPIPAPEPRRFAILKTPPGMNPWDLGSAYQNFTAVFGTKLHEWLLPIRHSPCTDHSSSVSEYPLGPEFQLLLEDAGLIQMGNYFSKDFQSSTTRSRRRKRRLDAGWQNGERPDGWFSEKEARRIRNEWRRRGNRNQNQNQNEDADVH